MINYAPQPNMNPAESRKGFSEAAVNEQINRTLRLRTILDRSEGKFRNFMDNVYKYTDRFNIEGSNPEETRQSFARAAAGMEELEQAVELFGHIKRKETGGSHNIEAIIDTHFYNGKLEVERVCNMFEWCLTAFVKGGSKIGREPDISAEEIPGLVDDMRYILRKVNDYLRER